MSNPLAVIARTLALVIAAGTPFATTLDACTRAVYLGPDDTVITVRSMDWLTDLGTNLWVMPRGIARDGAAGPGSATWTARYGSVIASAFDACTVDGINERGLAANVLYLSETVYPTPAANDPRQPVSVSVWGQYALDHFATVAEAVTALSTEPIRVAGVPTPDGHAGTAHLSLSDASGDSAVFEYVAGKLIIHHGRQYQVMTNSPVYDQQLALAAYWQQIGGTTMLPGTNRAADRFARASFYINAIPQTADPVEAVASAFSVIRNCSVPLGITTPGQPNVSSTIWRTVADHKRLRYYYESTRSPNVFWVDLAKLDLGEGKPVRTLTLTAGAIYAGEVSAQFANTKPFAFLPAAAH